MADSAVLTTAMSSMSMAVAAQTTVSVQRWVRVRSRSAGSGDAADEGHPVVLGRVFGERGQAAARRAGVAAGAVLDGEPGEAGERRAVEGPPPSWHESPPDGEDEPVGGAGAEHDAPAERGADAALAVGEGVGDGSSSSEPGRRRSDRRAAEPAVGRASTHGTRALHGAVDGGGLGADDERLPVVLSARGGGHGGGRGDGERQRGERGGRRAEAGADGDERHEGLLGKAESKLCSTDINCDPQFCQAGRVNAHPAAGRPTARPTPYASDSCLTCETQVGIVGAGPAGLLLAHLLGQARDRVGRASRSAAARTSSSGSAPACSSRARVDLLDACGRRRADAARGARPPRDRAALRRPRAPDRLRRR